MLANVDVVSNLHEIVEFDTIADHRVIDRAAVNRRIGADFNVIPDPDTANLRNLHQTSPVVLCKAEAVRSNDGAGMHDAAFTNTDT